MMTKTDVRRIAAAAWLTFAGIAHADGVFSLSSAEGGFLGQPEAVIASAEFIRMEPRCVPPPSGTTWLTSGLIATHQRGVDDPLRCAKLLVGRSTYARRHVVQHRRVLNWPGVLTIELNGGHVTVVAQDARVRLRRGK